ncbi:hypothetical protein EXU85_03130 [Spirosoma sp. KCTC 42546]|uniref:hypothetical protein n=1 Tax=Spirosoma sp. KCTC 42546 TaxID=2520506 RepID=UPI001159C6C3|nr:hypothetical protein [Spirosoma sp. KCTC 42546]QDK77639.1 hypothetical protein EXU85_03130 [Spirosoma sp. KCTC 42546]
MNKAVLLIGRNPNVLANLASALTEEGFLVKTTSQVEQASQNFNATDFDVIAFGRGIDAATNTTLRASFLHQNPAILFVDGLAPVIPLLVKQIKLELANKSVARQVITNFSCEQTDDTLRINVSTAVDCQLTIDLYQLDAVHHTQQKTIVSEFVTEGSHIFLLDDLPNMKTTINFLVAEVPDLDLAVVPI